jgi:hypothetical protein
VSLSLAVAIDDLYRDVVLDPHRWGDDAYAEWMENVASDAGGIDRDAARLLRRAVRIAMKLQRFWSSPHADAHRSETSWEARVDIAAGVPAWRPGLELAERDFETNPSEEGFEEVRHRFRVVNGAPWMGGIDYEQWRAGNADGRSG